MPQKRNNSEPPETMTLAKASPILVVAVIFDLVRIFFEWFIFFGPALGGAICTIAGSATDIGKLAGTAVTGAACGAVAGAAGFFGAEVIGPLGAIMAMAVGLLGWLVIGLWLMWTNARIFKENALWFISSLGIAEIPFIGSIPSFTLALWRMYHVQIKREKAALKKWKKENASAQLQERNMRQQQAAQLMQIRETELAQDGIY